MRQSTIHTVGKVGLLTTCYGEFLRAVKLFNIHILELHFLRFINPLWLRIKSQQLSGIGWRGIRGSWTQSHRPTILTGFFLGVSLSHTRQMVPSCILYLRYLDLSLRCVKAMNKNSKFKLWLYFRYSPGSFKTVKVKFDWVSVTYRIGQFK